MKEKQQKENKKTAYKLLFLGEYVTKETKEKYLTNK